jgi:hypothetical protein
MMLSDICLIFISGVLESSNMRGRNRFVNSTTYLFHVRTTQKRIHFQCYHILLKYIRLVVHMDYEKTMDTCMMVAIEDLHVKQPK